MASTDQLEGRLRQVETSVTTIMERLSHMPTKLGMWAAMAVVTLAVGSAVVAVLWWVIQQSLAPLLGNPGAL